MIVTKLGEGAKKLLDPEQSLLGADGLPKIVTPPPEENKILDPSESLENDTLNARISIKQEMLEQSEQSLPIAADSLNDVAPEPNTAASKLPTTTSLNELVPEPNTVASILPTTTSINELAPEPNTVASTLPTTTSETPSN